MTKRDAKKEVKGELRMDMEQEETYGLCSPLSETPSNSRNPKKKCANRGESETVSNEDIFQAVLELTKRISVFETQIQKNTEDVREIKEEMKGFGFQMKETEDKVKDLERRMEEVKEKTEEGERYSRRWNLRLVNLPEKENEDVRAEVMKIMSQIAPDDTSKIGFLIDSVHRVGRPRDDKTPRPTIIQFNMRTFRYKIWKESRNADIMKRMNLRIAEDLTRAERECRNKQWPQVEQARKMGKKTRWQGPVAYIDGVRCVAREASPNDK